MREKQKALLRMSGFACLPGLGHVPGEALANAAMHQNLVSSVTAAVLTPSNHGDCDMPDVKLDRVSDNKSDEGEINMVDVRAPMTQLSPRKFTRLDDTESDEDETNMVGVRATITRLSPQKFTRVDDTESDEDETDMCDAEPLALALSLEKSTRHNGIKTKEDERKEGDAKPTLAPTQSLQESTPEDESTVGSANPVAGDKSVDESTPDDDIESSDDESLVGGVKTIAGEKSVDESTLDDDIESSEDEDVMSDVKITEPSPLKASSAHAPVETGADPIPTNIATLRKKRQLSSMCLARKSLMTNVLCINQTQTVVPKSAVLAKMSPLPGRGVPRQAKLIDERLFATLLEHGERKDTVHIKAIRDHARAAGMDRMSNITIETYVMKLYGLREYKPCKTIDGKLVQASGFHHLKLRNIMPCSSVDKAPGPVKQNCEPVLTTTGLTTATVSQTHDKIAPVVALPVLKTAAAMVARQVVEASAWEKAVISKIHENLALPSAVSSMDTCVDSAHLDFEVGLGISADRDGFVRINQMRDAPQGTLSMLRLNQIIVYVDNVPVQEKSPETVRGMLVGAKDSLVKIMVAPSGNEVVLRRMYRPTPDAFTSDKVVFHGGSKQDRDNCIGVLQREYSAYCIDFASKPYAKTAETFSKTQLATSLVVVQYEEKVASNAGRGTNSIVSFNNKMQEEVYALTRCLFNGRFWDDALGPVIFDPPQKMFVFCNQQPQNLEEWEGWTFFNVSDRQA